MKKFWVDMKGVSDGWSIDLEGPPCSDEAVLKLASGVIAIGAATVA